MATPETEKITKRYKRYKRDHAPLKCDACGRFIPWDDLFEGRAGRRLLTPDSHFTCEEYETLCAKHR